MNILIITMKKLIYILVLLTFTVSLNAQWVQMSGLSATQNIPALASNSSYIFAGLKTDATSIKGVYRSSNNGSSFTATTLNSYDITSIAVSGNNVFAGTESNGIYRSTDNGGTFTQVLMPAYSGEYYITISGSNIYAGMYYMSGGAIYLSTNNGTNWTLLSQVSSPVKCLAINGSNIIAGTMAGVFYSTNNGVTFTQSSLNNVNVWSIAIYNNSSNIFAGTGGSGVYLSTNNGITWSQLTLNAERVNSLIVSNSQVFAGTSDAPSTAGSFYKYTGSSWTPRNEGLPTMYFGINSLLVANNYVFMGTQSYGLCRRIASEVIGIQNISTEIPSAYSLSQNYPNPFNPSTVVRFSLPVVGLTTLKVYDMMGREVQTLVNERLQAGTYEATFDGSQLSSGMYFYRLQTNGFTETKRMNFIK
jgi:Secretion system C-terminal sorting domain